MPRVEMGSFEWPARREPRRTARVLLLPLLAALFVMCTDNDDEIADNAVVGEAGESSLSAGASAGGTASAGMASGGGALPSGAPSHVSGGGGTTHGGAGGAAGEVGGPVQRCHIELEPTCLAAIEGSGGAADASVMSAVAELKGLSQVSGLNDHGKLVGSMDCSSATHAFMSENGNVHDILNGVGDMWSRASDINNHGVVVGSVAFEFDEEVDHYAPVFPFVWDAGETLVLQDLPGAQAVAINDEGQVLLRAEGGGALVWEDGVLTELGPLARAGDINNLGQVVGTLHKEPGMSVGFVWEAGVMTELPQLRSADAINDLGQIVGTASAQGTPVLLDGEELTELPLQGVPVEITNDGKVLGMNFLLSDGVVSRLTGRLGGDFFEGGQASDMNEAGLIIGVGEVLRFITAGRNCRFETCEDWQTHQVVWSTGCYGACCGEGSGGAGGAGGQAGQ